MRGKHWLALLVALAALALTAAMAWAIAEPTIATEGNRNVGSAAGIQADNSLLATHVVINEFAPKGTEWVELYNGTTSAVTLTGWYVADADCGSASSFIGTQSLAAGGYFVINAGDAGANFDLNSIGDRVVLCDASDVEIDRVAYGDVGGAPLAVTGSSAARTPNGTDTDDDARDFNIDDSPTLGAANDAPAVMLGSSLILNEFDIYPTTGNDKVEIYNPTTATITLTNWLLSDGDAVAPITTSVSVAPGGWLVLEETVDWAISMDFSGYDVGYLFMPSGVRVDQLGWTGEYEDDTFQRLPDGAGPNDGYDWNSSGGGVSLFDLPETLGRSNAALFFSKDAPTLVAPGELFTYTIVVTNRLGISLNNVLITDIIPVSTTFAYTLDGGVKNNGYISWTTPTLPNLGSWIVRFAVTATTNAPAIIVNGDYALDADELTAPATGAATLTAVGNRLSIHHLQWKSHQSPFEGQAVEDIRGIVTAVSSRGFYMQEPNPDADDATSEGIYVYTGSAPGRNIGDDVLVDGTVLEYYPGGYGTGNLSITELDDVTVVVSATGQTVPTPTIIGTGGRLPPTQVICGDCTGDVEDSPFTPDTDGIDFYESLEGMLLQVNDALAVGPTNKYGELPIVGDDGATSGLLTPRGGIVVRANDFNPERIILDDALTHDPPRAKTGAVFSVPITGVLDYSYGNFKLLPVVPPPDPSGGVISETTAAPAANQLRIASFNVLNLDPGDVANQRFAGLADQIVNNLQSPDIIGLQEVQDNNGATDDGTVDATQTFTTLIEAISDAGGPTYDFRQINPQNNQDGGQPGGNIRVGFLFRTDRGLSFVDRPGGDATTPVSVTLGATGVELNLSPGRVDPNNSAFADSRKPLAGEFTFNGHRLIVVVNHFNSKYGDDPLFGRVQPPVLGSETQRIQQAQVINDFVDDVLALDPNAEVVVLGDLNDFQFSTPVSDTLAADVLVNLVNTLPITEAYTYIYNGNSEVLDHILISQALYDRAFVGFDVVHVNAEFAYTTTLPSDHDPVVATLLLTPPDLSGSTKTVEPTGDVVVGDLLTYTITLDNGGGANALVTITDTLPAELLLVKGFDGGGLVWSGTVTAGEQVLLSLVVRADPTLTSSVAVSNIVTIDDGLSAAFDIHSPETTILVPGLTVAKDVTPTADLALGGIVTYTITLSNQGSGTAAGVVMTDDLPVEVSFGGWVQQSSAIQANGRITWTGDMIAGTQVTLVFTATVGSDESLNGQTVTNTAYLTSVNAGSGSDDAAFAIGTLWRTYLPLMFKDH